MSGLIISEKNLYCKADGALYLGHSLILPWRGQHSLSGVIGVALVKVALFLCCEQFQLLLRNHNIIV